MAKRVVPAFDVSCLAAVFPARRMLIFGDDILISLPEIAIAMSRAVSRRDTLPELAASGFAAITSDEGDHLARRAAQGDPNPAFATFPGHK